MKEILTFFVMAMVIGFSSIALAACDASGSQGAATAIPTLGGGNATSTTVTSPPTATDPTKGPSTDGWQSFTSVEGAFNVEFPGTPERGSSQTQSPLGELTIYTFRVVKNGSEFALLYVDYPEKALETDQQQLLEGAFGAVLGSNKATDQQPVSVQGNPGLVGEFQAQQGYVR